ncbi:MAG: PLP-dependent aminotransferase family protein [Lachnospiraceae bacterium]|nr:PLP-dependent aminotransferase family protein [Lachnospiraceae bacterium]
MFDMTIQLQTGTGVRLYEQIYEHIKNEIREGKLLCGERLPSTRSLAEYLQISRSTVDCAYEQLLSEGYIESRPYRGYFVCQIEDLLELSVKLGSEENAVFGGKNAHAQVHGETQNHSVASENIASVANIHHNSATQEAKNVITFHPNGIDMSQFPFGTWQRINRNVLSYDNRQMFTLGEAQGDLELRINISRYLHISRGVECSPEQIIVGAGNEYLLMLLEKILGRHIPVAMEYLSYKKAYRIFRSFAYPVTLVGMDEQGMKVDELAASQAKLAYVMPAHQYPTGTVMPIGRRMELLKWASNEPDRYIIEDDYDSEFRYKGKPIPSLQASDKKGKVIYIGTFSKAIAPAIRVSYMVLPEGLLQAYREKCWFYSSTVSRIDQRILNEFISGGYFERYLNKARKLYKQKHEVLLEALKPFTGKFKISGEHAGLHLLLTAMDSGERHVDRNKNCFAKDSLGEEVPVEEERTEAWLIERAAAQGVKVFGLSEALIEEELDLLPDSVFEATDSLGAAGTMESEVALGAAGTMRASHTVLLGYGGLSEEQILGGIERLKKAWL